MNVEDVIKKLEELSTHKEVEEMARFGISPKRTYGIRMPVLKSIAKECGKSHELATELWEIDTRETRIIASLVDIPKAVTPEQMDIWASGFDYWEICDQCCINLFRKTEFAYDKIYEWTEDDKEFVKRAGFALIATLAVHDKKEGDETFEELLKLTKREACDERNYVKKAVNWAIRQVGKRNKNLNKSAVLIADEIDEIDCKTAHWIAKDALRELNSEKVHVSLDKKEMKEKKRNK